MPVRSWIRSLLHAWEGDRPKEFERPPSEFWTTAPEQIHELLEELRLSKRALTLQFTHHHDVCAAELIARDDIGLKLLPPSGADFCLRDGEVVNVVARTERGVTMFTLRPKACTRDGRLLAELPEALIRMQSRQHRRLRCLHGRGHRAELSLQPCGNASPFELMDLSEEGACVHWRSDAPPEVQARGNLVIDGSNIELPRIRSVHSQLITPGVWRVGLKLEGMPPDASRLLRRWLNLAETASCQSV